jgi:hypothetical protein
MQQCFRMSKEFLAISWINWITYRWKFESSCNIWCTVLSEMLNVIMWQVLQNFRIKHKLMLQGGTAFTLLEMHLATNFWKTFYDTQCDTDYCSTANKWLYPECITVPLPLTQIQKKTANENHQWPYSVSQHFKKHEQKSNSIPKEMQQQTKEHKRKWEKWNTL